MKEAIAYKETLRRRAFIDERKLHMTGDIVKLIEYQSRLMIEGVCKVLKMTEFEHKNENVSYEYFPATWFDHLKMSLMEKFPKARLSYDAIRVRTKISCEIQINRMCPHHSAIATDRHCERFLTNDHDFSMPVFDALTPESIMPIYQDFAESGNREYRMEVSPNVFSIAEEMMRAQSFGQSVVDFLGNAKERDINAWRYPFLVELWEAIYRQPFGKVETPNDYLKHWHLFGCPVHLNPNLPAGSWRIL